MPLAWDCENDSWASEVPSGWSIVDANLFVYCYYISLHKNQRSCLWIDRPAAFPKPSAKSQITLSPCNITLVPHSSLIALSLSLLDTTLRLDQPISQFLGHYSNMSISVNDEICGLYLLSTLYRNSELATSAGLTYSLLGGLSSCFILLGTS